MSTTPPPPPGGPPPFPPPPGPGGAPGGAPAEGGTRSPLDSMTRYDEAKDAYHCSYGIPTAARTLWDPERELIVRVDLHSPKVIGFSIPNFIGVAEDPRAAGRLVRGRPAARSWPMDQVQGA